MRRRMKGYAAALALGAVSLLGACTTPPATDPPSSTSTSGSSSTSAGVTPPASTSTISTPPSPTGVPEAARANSAEGAVAFTQYFLAKANAAYSASDSHLYQDLVLASCKTCSAMTSTLEGYRAKQYRYVGDFVTPVNVTISTFNGSDVGALVSTDTKASKVYAPDGSLVQEVAAAKGNIVVQLMRDANDWRVSGIKGS